MKDSDLQTRAKRVYDTLVKEPALLHELLSVVQQHRRNVAGPWVEEHEGRWKRVGSYGENIAVAVMLNDGWWRWTVAFRGTPVNGVSQQTIDQGRQPVALVAKNAADKHLVENMWNFSELINGT